MDKFYLNNINDLYNKKYLAQQKTGTAPAEGSTGGIGLNTSDLIGLGLQLYGANKADRAAEEERLRQERKDEENQNLELLLKGRSDRTSAQQFEEQMQNQSRQMNMNAMEYLANQRANAMQNRRFLGMRNAMAKAFSRGGQ